MKEIILIKDGELSLKGLNRSTFEDILIKNIRRHLSSLGDFNISKSQSTVMVEPVGEIDMEAAADRIGKIFGIAGYSTVACADKNMQSIEETAVTYLKEKLMSAKTFKVEAKRSDKRFPLKSPEICADIGEVLLNNYPNLSVDVHNPDVTAVIEIRDEYAFVRADQIKGAGGMPTGTAGRAALLISGGIDSPVAGYMMAKRGISLTAVHFASPPYTSERAEEKVHKLLSKVAEYSGRTDLITVHFTEIQEAIKDNCPEDCFTIIMRRMMMRIASKISKKEGCKALITGESLGQVASQTLPALVCTDESADIPVFRPLIGMDKDEIIAVSRKIDTFDISIEPYEDCCTVFTPKHPKTRPTVEEIEKAEKALDIDKLTENAMNNLKYDVIY